MKKYIILNFLFVVSVSYAMEQDQPIHSIPLDLESISSFLVERYNQPIANQNIDLAQAPNNAWSPEIQSFTRFEFEPDSYFFSYNNEYKIHIEGISISLESIRDKIEKPTIIKGKMFPQSFVLFKKFGFNFIDATLLEQTREMKFPQINRQSVHQDINFSYLYENLRNIWQPVMKTLQVGESFNYNNKQLSKIANGQPVVITGEQQKLIRIAYNQMIYEIQNQLSSSKKLSNSFVKAGDLTSKFTQNLLFIGALGLFIIFFGKLAIKGFSDIFNPKFYK